MADELLEIEIAVATSIYGQQPVVDANTAKSAVRMFSLPGSRLFCLSLQVIKETITGQIALKMSLDTMLSTILELEQRTSELELIVKEALKKANSEVYGYAHRMGAGGAMGARALIFGCCRNHFFAARAGASEGYLFRAGQLLPLFDSLVEKESGAELLSRGQLSRFVGANSQVLVDLAETDLLVDDILFFASEPLTPEGMRVCQSALLASAERIEREDSTLKLRRLELALNQLAREEEARRIFLLLGFSAPSML